MKSFIAAMVIGAGRIFSPAPGNMGNAPGPSPVQVGRDNYIQRPMFPDVSITNVGAIPPGYIDGGGMPLNVEGLSGNTGGGIGQANAAPAMSQGPALSYDTQTGNYFLMGSAN